MMIIISLSFLNQFAHSAAQNFDCLLNLNRISDSLRSGVLPSQIRLQLHDDAKALFNSLISLEESDDVAVSFIAENGNLERLTYAKFSGMANVDGVIHIRLQQNQLEHLISIERLRTLFQQHLHNYPDLVMLRNDDIIFFQIDQTEQVVGGIFEQLIDGPRLILKSGEEYLLEGPIHTFPIPQEAEISLAASRSIAEFYFARNNEILNSVVLRNYLQGQHIPRSNLITHVRMLRAQFDVEIMGLILSFRHNPLIDPVEFSSIENFINTAVRPILHTYLQRLAVALDL